MKNQQTGLNLNDLSHNTLPSFSGISGQFFEQAATYINYAVPANNQITKTPQNKAGQAKMQQIMRRMHTPKQHAARVGNSMACSQNGNTTFLDQTVNNKTIINDYALPIITELIRTDVEYLQQKLYGDANYLQNIQQSTRPMPQLTQNDAYVMKYSGKQVNNSQRPTSRPNSRMVLNAPSSSYGNFQSSQASTIPKTEVLQQKDIMKAVDYICQIIYKESYCLETQYFAVSLLHRALSALQIRRSELKLLAAVCIFAATKHEENYGEALGTSALVAYFGGAFTTQQILKAELRFLNVIDWRLGVSSVNARTYLRTLFRDLGLDLRLAVLASYLAEIALLDQKFLQFTGFELALAAIELASISVYIQPFDERQQHSTVEHMFLATSAANANSMKQAVTAATNKQMCRKMLSEMWIEVSTKGQATQIYKKYCEEPYFGVAKRPPVENIDEVIEKLGQTL